MCLQVVDRNFRTPHVLIHGLFLEVRLASDRLIHTPLRRSLSLSLSLSPDLCLPPSIGLGCCKSLVVPCFSGSPLLQAVQWAIH